MDPEGTGTAVMNFAEVRARHGALGWQAVETRG